MSKTMVIEMPDKAFADVQEVAENQKKPAEKLVVDIVLSSIPRLKRDGKKNTVQAEERFNRWIGSFDSGDSRSADNEQIDADLAAEYGKDL